MNEVLKSFLINFSLKDGLSPDRESIKSQLSNMNGMECTLTRRPMNN